MFYPSGERRLITLQDLDVDEIKKEFFADDQSENAARVKLLEQIIDEAEIDDEMEGALRRSNDAQEEWVLMSWN